MVESMDVIKLDYLPLVMLSLSSSSGGGDGVPNTAPTITSPATAPVEEDTTSVVAVTVTDAEGASPNYSLSGGAGQSAFSINATTGALSFTSASDFEVPTDTDTNTDNVYEVQVAVSDGVASTTQNITATVTNKNDNAPVITCIATPPVINSWGLLL